MTTSQVTTPLTLDGEYRCLSTMHPGWVLYGGQNWPSIEHALAAARCQTEKLADYDQHWKEIWKLNTPEKARHKSKRLPLRKDWPQVRDNVLRDLVQQTLAKNPGLSQKLKDTGGRLLLNVEDTEFGCVIDDVTQEIRGKNRLGNLLMKLRADLG